MSTHKGKPTNSQSKLRPQWPILPLLLLGLMLVASIGAQHSPASAEEVRVTICHHTGSASNPYVEITIDMNALQAHVAHGDVYPVPPSGCPIGGIPSSTSTAVPTGTPTNASTFTPTYTPTNSPTLTATATATSTSTPEPTQTTPPDPGPDGSVTAHKRMGCGSRCSTALR